MSNMLATETSPYLLQHADDPVAWYPWGDAAFAAARDRDVPVFLSVGYAACHWCHVMARESFQDPATAELLNDGFVSVKVDREERPDVDLVYLAALQAMTGHGGWPMSVFLTPDGSPFLAGTYWPAAEGHGLPSFTRVLTAVRQAWQEDRDGVLAAAERVSASLAPVEPIEQEAPAGAAASLVGAAIEAVVGRAWDRTHGGFGRAPRFPMAPLLTWLLDHHRRTGAAEPLEAVTHTLTSMVRGGIHDQLGGGFARYATDDDWLVPHFEKMVSDQALLLPVLAEAARAADNDELAAAARSTADWLLREARTPAGTFISAVDADSEGVEGRYYIWSYDDLAGVIRRTLEVSDAEVARWCEVFGASPEGNWEGVNVLHRPMPEAASAAHVGLAAEGFRAAWERLRSALAGERAQRVPPAIDGKALTDVNALAVRGLVLAGRLLDEPAWITAGAEVAGRLHDDHVVERVLHHVRTDGRTAVPGFLEDHAALALADLELLETTGDLRWFDRARQLAEAAESRFADPSGGWFLAAAEQAAGLPSRPVRLLDDATPSGVAMMVEVCRRLAGLTGDRRWWRRAADGLERLLTEVERAPGAGGWALRQVEAELAGPCEVVVVGRPGPQRDELHHVAEQARRPGMTLLVVEPPAAGGPDVDLPVLAGRTEVQGRPAAYVCRDLACELPVTSPDELRGQLELDRANPGRSRGDGSAR